MNILSKVKANVQSKGHNQLGVTFKSETVEHSNIKKGDPLSITVLENGSILIEKVDKKHESR